MTQEQCNYSIYNMAIKFLVFEQRLWLGLAMEYQKEAHHLFAIAVRSRQKSNKNIHVHIKYQIKSN